MSTENSYSSDSTSDSGGLGPNAIAVIGMAGRFPGADSVAQFWDNLCAGKESIETLSEETLTAAGVSAKTLADPTYVRRAPLLNGIEEFDADYFGINPYTARMMDPQQRLFLQTAWHALEDSGYDPDGYDGSIGVFASSTASGYLMDNLMSHRDEKTLVGEGITVEMFNLILETKLTAAEKTDLVAFLRPEEKFDSLDQMTSQVMRDAGVARELLAPHFK